MSSWSRRRSTTPDVVRRPEAVQQPAPTCRLVIGDQEMRDLLTAGKARPLSRVVTSFVRHDDRWWLDATGEWLAITDPDYAAKLDAWASAGATAPE